MSIFRLQLKTKVWILLGFITIIKVILPISYGHQLLKAFLQEEDIMFLLRQCIQMNLVEQLVYHLHLKFLPIQVSFKA